MKNLSFDGQTVLVRVDFNVPLDAEHNVTDDTRIAKAIPTIQHITESGGKVVIMSHFGRPQKKRLADGSIDVEGFTLRHVIPTLEKHMEKEVQFASDSIGSGSRAMIHALASGDVLLLENTRFHAGDEQGDEALAKSFAESCDLFVNDAFGAAHRAHASTSGVANCFEKDKKAFGLLMERELKNASKLLDNPEKPVIAIMGGAKVSDKIGLIGRLLDLTDVIVVGGAMAFTFVKAQGGAIGDSMVEEDRLDDALAILEAAQGSGVQFVLPSDARCTTDFADDPDFAVYPINAIPDGWRGLDIGPASEASFARAISNAKTILWNGPMGVFEFENFATGTLCVAHAVAEVTALGAYSLVGGGDSVAALKLTGLDDKISFISTGGGAMLEFLEGKTLPGVAAILEDVE